jgi:hypothetical protein
MTVLGQPPKEPKDGFTQALLSPFNAIIEKLKEQVVDQAKMIDRLAEINGQLFNGGTLSAEDKEWVRSLRRFPGTAALGMNDQWLKEALDKHYDRQEDFLNAWTTAVPDRPGAKCSETHSVTASAGGECITKDHSGSGSGTDPST